MSIFERSKKMEQISLEDINLDIIPIKVLQDVDGEQPEAKTLMHTFRIS